MRMYAKRLALLCVGSFLVTLVLLALPNTSRRSGPRSTKDLFDRRVANEHVTLATDFYKDNELAGDQQPSELGKDDSGRPRFGLPPQQADVGDTSGLAERLALHDFEGRRAPADPATVEVISKHLKRKFGKKNITAEECPIYMTIGQYWRKHQGESFTPKADSWDRWHEGISTCASYTDDTAAALERDLAALPLKAAEIMDGGTQVKLKLTFSNDKFAVYKPMRFGREYETDANHFYFTDFERHTAEIAAYHLDKVLGYKRAVPTVGRVFNLSEIWSKADHDLAKTFFWSPANNLCFVAKCDYYCDTTHAMCGRPDMKEGSVQAFLPDDDLVERQHMRSPYRRTYSKRDQLAVWQKDQTYCEWKVKKKKYYAKGRLLLDLIDVHILDFLMGNQDRHHLERIKLWSSITPAAPIHLDNGRGFGSPRMDDLSIIMPLAQCCVIRPSTLQTLLHFYAGPVSLSRALHQSLGRDPVAPILPAKHLDALERRLGIIMQTIKRCFDTHPDPDSIITTLFQGQPDLTTYEGEGNADADAQGNNEQDNTRVPLDDPKEPSAPRDQDEAHRKHEKARERKAARSPTKTE